MFAQRQQLQDQNEYKIDQRWYKVNDKAMLMARSLAHQTTRTIPNNDKSTVYKLLVS